MCWGILVMLIFLCSSDGVGVAFNQAHVDTSLDEDVTANAPSGTPRVTDDPVVLAAESSVSDASDGVVGVSRRCSA